LEPISHRCAYPPRTSFATAALAAAAPAAASKTAVAGAGAAAAVGATGSAKAATGGALAAKAAATGAAVSSASAATDAAATGAPGGLSRYSGWLSAIADPLEDFLLKIQLRLRSINCPYPQGVSIILLTAMVKVVTFPFTKKQIESSLSMQNLQPQIKALRERWAGDENLPRLNSELSALYKLYGVNPLAGCVPTLLTLPVFWGLYRALINGSLDGAFTEPFFIVPSLGGPTYDTFAGNTGGISWLWPFDPVTHAPPIGWPSAQKYLVLPTLLVVSQYVTSVILPPTQPEDGEKENQTAENVKVLTKVLPLFVGYFSLTLPAGMGLYWLANNVFTTATTYYLKELGGAQTSVPKLVKPKLKLGTAIRSGAVAEAMTDAADAPVLDAPALVDADARGSVAPDRAPEAAVPAVAEQVHVAAPAVVEPTPQVEQAAAMEPVAVAASSAVPVVAAAHRAVIPRRSKRLKDANLRKTVSNPGGKTTLTA
jgi:YidC/Oxa1 family membrane protein insertase